MARCFRCERTEKEVKLSDALYENDLVKVCERCAITENIPVLRKPSTSQLKAADKSQGVYERLKRLSGTREPEKTNRSMLAEINKLDEHPELEKPDSRPFNLVRNFHWHVMRARRDRRISLSHLAAAIGESETALKMVERGELPEDPGKLIKKLEQFFQIRIREVDEEELERERRKKEEKAKERAMLEAVPEPIEPILEEEVEEGDLVEVKAEEIEEEKQDRPARVLKFKPELMDNITIADLKKIKEEKESAEMEEERKKEQRQKELKDKVAQEMKTVALGGEKETIEEKRAMLNRAIQGIGEKKKEEIVPSIQELYEKKKDKEKAVLEKEKIEARMLERKSEQEQIKEALRGKPEESLKKAEKIPEKKAERLEIQEEKMENADFQKLSELSENKGKQEALLGDDIEVIDE